ncbi:MAG: zinc-ribbon domain-containing protein [Lachnospiraceae bacterium]|jgi:hypothetical protein|nr:zinc-ribbon domain-containing protein [Lachnospiraceae bacterium]
MFCAKCGKEIEDDSVFCPFCGQPADAPVEGDEAEAAFAQGPKKPHPLPGGLSSRKFLGIALSLAVAVLVIFGAVKVIGGLGSGKRSLPEELFALSWEELSQLSLEDMEDLLDDAGILYDENDTGIETVIPEPFFEGECLFEYDALEPEFTFAVGFSSTDDFKEFKKGLEEYLDKRMIENTVVMSEKNFGEFWSEDMGFHGDLYLIEISAEELETFVDTYVEGMDALDIEGKEYGVYKLIGVEYTKQGLENYAEEAAFSLDGDYIGRSCLIYAGYQFVEKSEFIAIQAMCGQDVISGKEIDITAFKKSLNREFVDFINQIIEAESEDSESRKLYEKTTYTMLYLMEKHNFDMLSVLDGIGSYRTDEDWSPYLNEEEKQEWYIENFGYDMENQEFVETTVAYRSEQEESGLRMVDDMFLRARGDRVVAIREVIQMDMSYFDQATQRQMKAAYDDLVEQYGAVDGVECTGTVGPNAYTITIAIDATGDAVETLADQGLLQIEGDGSKLSLKATGEALEAEGYRRME